MAHARRALDLACNKDCIPVATHWDEFDARGMPRVIGADFTPRPVNFVREEVVRLALRPPRGMRTTV